MLHIVTKGFLLAMITLSRQPLSPSSGLSVEPKQNAVCEGPLWGPQLCREGAHGWVVLFCSCCLHYGSVAQVREHRNRRSGVFSSPVLLLCPHSQLFSPFGHHFMIWEDWLGSFTGWTRGLACTAQETSEVRGSERRCGKPDLNVRLLHLQPWENLLNLSDPEFPHLEAGDNNAT